MTVRGALCAASGAALLVLVALVGCPLVHREAQWSEAVLGWAQLAEARAAAWWTAHSPAAVAAWPPQPPAALRAALQPSLPRQLAQPLAVVLELPDHHQLRLREDETLESLVAKLLQEQAGLHPTAIELVSVEEIRQQRTSPFRAVLRAVAALREPSALHAVASAGSEGASGDVAALTADPALQQLAAGDSAAARLLSDVGSAGDSKQALQTGQLSSERGRRALKSGRKLRQQALIHAAQQADHPLLKLFGPARTFDGPAEPVSAQQQAAAAEGLPLVIVELTLVGQEGGRHPHLWSLLDSLSSRLGSTEVSSSKFSSNGLWQRAGAGAAEPAEAAASEAADISPWSVAAHLANAEEYLQSLLPLRQPAQPSRQPSHPRQRRSHTHSHTHSHRHHSWVQDGLALPARPPPSPLKLAALDTVFVAATLVALVCTALLVADIWRHGLRPSQEGAATGSSCRGCPAGALVALGQPEQQPLLVVVAADEVAAAQQAGYSPL